MEARPTTKKFLNALTADGYASGRSAVVVPDLDGNPWFVDVRTGKRHDTAYVVYVGRSITTDDVLEAIQIEIPDEIRVRQLVNSVIVSLPQFRIGNVVAVTSPDGMSALLRCVANSPKRRPGPSLP